MYYDKKFREIVLKHIEKGNDKEETRKLFGLGTHTISQWEKLREETGSLGNRPLERSYRKIDPEKLKKDVEENPEDFNEERAKRFGCSKDGIRLAMKKQKLTRKKKRKSTASEMKQRERSIRQK